MATRMILTLISPDRPGIVSRIAACIREHGGSWEESRMAQLGGCFTGVLQVSVDGGKMSALQDALASVDPEITFQFFDPEQSMAKTEESLTVQISLCGQDQPGIVETLFSVFSENGVNVEELKSSRRGAPWSGHTLFEATARLRMPATIDLGTLRNRLEAIAGDLAVDLDWIQ